MVQISKEQLPFIRKMTWVVIFVTLILGIYFMVQEINEENSLEAIYVSLIWWVLALMLYTSFKVYEIICQLHGKKKNDPKLLRSRRKWRIWALLSMALLLLMVLSLFFI